MSQALESNAPLTSDDALDILNSDEPSDKPEDKSDDKVTKPEKLDELESDAPEGETNELEEQPEQEETEQPELDDETFEDIPKRKEILAAFPELFKKFPGVEKAIYREQQYTEVFPTPNDAKEANERLSTLNEVENQLLSGDIGGLLAQVKQADGEAFSKIASNLLQTIGKVDPGAQSAILNSVLKETLNTAYRTGTEAGDENGQQLALAAQHLHRFIYGTHKIDPTNRQQVAVQPNDREQQLSRREQQFQEQQLSVAVNEVSGRVDNSIKSWLDRNIDPKEQMTPYVKTKAMSDVLSQIQGREGVILSDPRFKAHLDKLWQDCIRTGYSESAKQKIKTALLQRAKAVLPGITQRVKADALKGLAVRSREASSSKDESPVRSGRPANSSKNSSKDDGPKKGESALDFLMRD